MDINRLLVYETFGCAVTFIQAAPTPKPECHMLTGTVPVTTDPDICKPTLNTLGNGGANATLDFSKAEKKAFGLLANPFDKISGAFVMEGNEQMDTVNFAAIEIFDGTYLPESALFISIRNNPNLEKLTWDPSITKLTINDKGQNLFIYIYNNPKLSATSLEMIKKELDLKTQISRALQTGPNECRFQHPFNLGYFETPPINVLKQCQNIEGDMKMDGGSLKDLSLTLNNGACLRLTNVDMMNAHISLRSGTLSPICKDNSTKSEIKNNAGLCGNDLVKLETAFSNSTVIIEADASCGAICKTLADIGNKFAVCQTIDGVDADISKWFTDGKLKSKSAKLKNILTTVAIQNIADTTINLAGLIEVKHLKITGNTNLVNIDLGTPTKIDQLTITGNMKFTGSGQLTNITLTKATVECYLKGKTIQDFNAYRICTHLFGPLLLEGTQLTVDVHFLEGKTIDGCVTVRNTDLKSVDFLYKANFTGCTTEHLLENNPDLCPIKMLGKVVVTTKGTHKTQGCEKSCQSLATGCVRLVNDLTISDSTKQQYLDLLEFLDGSLTMKDTKMTKLVLPKLTQISSSKAPAIFIENNAQLELIDMPKLKMIQANGNGKPLAKFINNSKLKIPPALSTTLGNCGSDPKGACYVQVNGSLGGTGNEKIFWIWIASGVVLVIGTAVVLIVLWKKGKLGCCKKKKEKESPKTVLGGKKSEEDDKTKTKEETELKEEDTQDSLKGKGKASMSTDEKDEPKDFLELEDYKLIDPTIAGTPCGNKMEALVKSPEIRKTGAVVNKEYKDDREAAKIEGKTWRRMKCNANKKKNRYGDVFAVDDTLVLLTGSYIHANRVNGVGPDETNKIICTQAPLSKSDTHDDTVADFWQMIFEKRSTAAIMLCRLLEKSKGKTNVCAPYFPQEKAKPIEIGHMKIHLRFVKKLTKNITQRRLMMEVTEPDQKAKYHFLDHYQYDAWPDYGFPDMDNAMDLFLLRQAMKEAWKAHHKPIVIHCFAGIGRTGTLVLLDHIMTKLENGESVNIRELLYSLRKQRAGSVQTVSQYLGVYRLLVEKAIREELVPRNDMKDFLSDWSKEVKEKNPTTPNGSKESTSKESTASKESASQERAK